MSKVLFNVLLPATGRHYDLWVPDDLPMQQVALLVSEALQVAEPAFHRKTPGDALMYRMTGEIQDPFATASQIGFVDGDEFVLV